MKQIAAALLKVQAEIRVIKKNSRVKVQKEGRTLYETTYADLGAIWEAIHAILTKHEIAVVQAPTFRDGVFLLKTILLHGSGETIEGEYLVRPAREGAQEYGSAVTYARRYSLCAMLGLVTADDDGLRASTRGKAANVDKVKDQDFISAAERIAMKKVWKKAGKNDDIVMAYLKEAYDVDSTAKVRKDDYQDIMAWCAEPKPAAGA